MPRRSQESSPKHALCLARKKPTAQGQCGGWGIQPHTPATSCRVPRRPYSATPQETESPQACLLSQPGLCSVTPNQAPALTVWEGGRKLALQKQKGLSCTVQGPGNSDHKWNRLEQSDTPPVPPCGLAMGQHPPGGLPHDTARGKLRRKSGRLLSQTTGVMRGSNQEMQLSNGNDLDQGAAPVLPRA